MIFPLIKTIIVSAILIFLIQQIYTFIKSNITPPKIKIPRVEKYKTMFEEVAAAAASSHAPHKKPANSPPQKVSSAAAAAAAALLNLESLDLEEIKDLNIDELIDDDINDNESVYSEGYSAIKEEMEQDLLQLIMADSAATGNGLILPPSQNPYRNNALYN